MIGIFGGTFDPIHNGHVNIIEDLLSLVELDELIIIPNGNPPHKKKRIEESLKLAMTKMALEHIPGVVIDSRELNKKEPSYAYETLLDLKKEHPQDELLWIMGSDSFLDIESWYSYKKFIKEVNILVLQRPNYFLNKKNGLTDPITERSNFTKEDFSNDPNQVYLLKIKPIEITSTHIRQMIYSDKDVASFIDPNVNAFIKENNLYK